MTQPAACPKCGDVRCAVATDGSGGVASMSAVCIGCGHLTTWVVDLTDDAQEADRG